MGLPLFKSPPSPSAKNASRNTEKAVAQNRSTIRRQRTVRGNPNWALSELRETAASDANRTAPTNADNDRDREVDLEHMRAEASAMLAENARRRRNLENRHTLRDSLSYEPQQYQRARDFSHPPAAPAAPATLSMARGPSWRSEALSRDDNYHPSNHRQSSLARAISNESTGSAIHAMRHRVITGSPRDTSTESSGNAMRARIPSGSPRDTSTETTTDTAERQNSFMDHYSRIHSAHRRILLDRNRRDSASRSASPPTPFDYRNDSASSMPGGRTIEDWDSLLGSSPHHSSSHHLTMLRNHRLRTRASNQSTSPNRPSRGSRMSDLLAQRSRRIRARDLPDGLGDRDRSVSPDIPADWDTLSVTLAPDPHAPSTANSSFASANASTNPSTAIASAASSASDSQSSATSASSETHLFSRPIGMNAPGRNSTRSIPDFSIPSGSANRTPTPQAQASNPDSTAEANCDSGDDSEEELVPLTLEDFDAILHAEDSEEDDPYELGNSIRDQIESNPYWLTYTQTRDIERRRTHDQFSRPNAAEDVSDLRLPPITASAAEIERYIADGRRRLPGLSSVGESAVDGMLREITERNDSLTAQPASTTIGELEDEEASTLGGMQRIVRLLAERRDIPDTWWAGAGLSRMEGGSVVSRGEGDDDMRLEG